MCYKEITVFAIIHVLLQETALMYLLSVHLKYLYRNVMLYFLQFLLPSWSISLEKNIFNLSECFYLDKQRIYESLFAKKMIAASTLWPEVVHCCTNWLDIIHKRYVWQIIGQQLIFHSLNTCRRLLAYTVNYFLAQHQLVWIHDLPCTPTSC